MYPWPESRARSCNYHKVQYPWPNSVQKSTILLYLSTWIESGRKIDDWRDYEKRKEFLDSSSKCPKEEEDWQKYGCIHFAHVETNLKCPTLRWMSDLSCESYGTERDLSVWSFPLLHCGHWLRPDAGDQVLETSRRHAVVWNARKQNKNQGIIACLVIDSFSLLRETR